MMEGSVVTIFLVASVSVSLFFFSLSEALPHDELSGFKVLFHQLETFNCDSPMIVC